MFSWSYWESIFILFIFIFQKNIVNEISLSIFFKFGNLKFFSLLNSSVSCNTVEALQVEKSLVKLFNQHFLACCSVLGTASALRRGRAWALLSGEPVDTHLNHTNGSKSPLTPCMGAEGRMGEGP